MSFSFPKTLQPTSIVRANQHDVKIIWRDGTEVVYPARRMRMECPCAVCVDEVTGRRQLQEAMVAEDVHPTGIEPIGHYAIQIYFSDGHHTGIYTWEKLIELGKKIVVDSGGLIGE